MIENSLVWSLTVRVSYTDNTVREITIMRNFGISRSVSVSDFLALFDIRRSPAFKQFMITMGYPVTSGSLPTNVNDYEFRFMGLATSGNSIYVAGGNKQMAATVESNDLTATLALLNADPYFVSLFTGLQ